MSFTILSSHPNDPNSYPIPVTSEMITGSAKLKHIQAPFSFYWRPGGPTFKGVDAPIRSGNAVWTLQFTIGDSHRSATEGLDEVYKNMNHKTSVSWRLVIVGPDQNTAESARDQQNLTGRWKKTTVYACELPLGKFPKTTCSSFRL